MEESEASGLRLNAAAREALGGTTPISLDAALLALGADASEAAQLLRRARKGERAELAIGSELRVLFAPASTGNGRACVVLAPTQSLDHATLQRRALATDRSARVSHELANALGAIAGWARLAREGARVDEALDLIEKSAETAWSAARTVLGEVRGEAPNVPADDKPAAIDLSAFVDEAARLLMPKALKKNVAVRTSITPGLCIAGDRSSAWSIVWNLATNAVEALGSGGSVLLQLTATGNLVHLCISDDGPGMSTEVRARIFDPYFTTKRTGTGLGLSVVRQAVAELGGRMELDTQPGRGTRFQIDFPRVIAAEKPRRRSNTGSDKRSSGVFVAEHLEGRFLVLDDDPSLREMIATALQMRGAEVVSVATLAEALATQGPFKLAITDLMLGDQRGDVALARMRNAGLISLGMLVTGTELPKRFAANGEPDAVLRKPFELQDLFESVAEVLSRSSSEKSAAR